MDKKVEDDMQTAVRWCFKGFGVQGLPEPQK